MKKAAEPKSERRAIPFVKISKMYTERATVEKIAKAVGRYNEQLPDPTKSVRAIISRMITIGYENENGKIVKLKKRARVATAKASKGDGKANPTKKAQKKPRKAKSEASEAQPVTA